MSALWQLREADYRPHDLHHSDRPWSETNCYVDAWIEILHCLGLQPQAAGACALSIDFDGEAWRLLKYPLEDLRRLYGVEVYELNMWRPLVVHLEQELDRGRICTVEVDAFYLPDTAGTTYRSVHDKTTIVPQSMESDRRHLGYFHNAGYYELDGDDFDGVLLRSPETATCLPPYVEVIHLEGVVHDSARQAEVGAELLAEHLARRPRRNPVEGLGAHVLEHVDELRATDMEDFHKYAFNTLRQCGATAAIAAEFLLWFAARRSPDMKRAADGFQRVAELAKATEFALARVAAGRNGDLVSPLSEMASSWRLAMDDIDRCRDR